MGTELASPNSLVQQLFTETLQQEYNITVDEIVETVPVDTYDDITVIKADGTPVDINDFYEDETPAATTASTTLSTPFTIAPTLAPTPAPTPTLAPAPTPKNALEIKSQKDDSSVGAVVGVVVSAIVVFLIVVTLVVCKSVRGNLLPDEVEVGAKWAPIMPWQSAHSKEM